MAVVAINQTSVLVIINIEVKPLNIPIMKTNVSSTDRFIRIMMSILLFALFGFKVLPEFWHYTSLLGAIILGATGIVGFCPLVALFKMTQKE